MIDQKTTNQDYPLPNPSNKLSVDVLRIQDTFEKIDVDVGVLHTASTTASTDIDNIRNGSVWQANSTGFGAAYQVVLNPAPSTLTFGQVIYMTAHVQNTGPATLDVNGLGVKTIKKTDGSDLRAGDILTGAVCHLNYDGINFQLLNPKVDQEQTEINTSNIMRVFEEIQESHGGSLKMEAGWSDSFSNPNEQGADEANSSGYQHDPTDNFYKGTDSGLNLNSDKNYDTESNYLQQEWNKSTGIGTSQATVNSGITVTLSSGIWPTNCENGRISFDSGSTWFDISSRDSDTSLTLRESTTDGTYDYIIRMSEFDSGILQLSSNGDFSIGDGRDGSVTITSSQNINTNILGSLRSTNSDGISTSVTANPTGTSITVSNIAGFTNGDKILLINLQGASGDIVDVGNQEILTVDGLPSGSTINVEETIVNSYDGTTFSNQKIICQRIPQWTDVNINSGGDLTCNAWNGTSGGVLVFYASGTVTVTSGRTINADSKGYRGGAKGVTINNGSYQGESRTGVGSISLNSNDGGGGGSYASSTQNGDGGGGGYGTAGATATAGNAFGIGGNSFGDVNLSDVFMGSGGGGGAYHWHGAVGASNGAIGGGIIYIIAQTVSVAGNITSKGGISDSSSAGTGTLGGGGAGGSVFINAQNLTLGADSIAATGGHGNSGASFSKGGDGRIRLEYSIINATTFQSATDENTGCNPNPGSTADASMLSAVSSKYISVCDLEIQKTDTSAWSDINSGSVTETLNSQNAYYWLTFDPASGFGDGTEIKVFNITGSVWRKIARNNSGTWEYNNNAAHDAVETWVASTIDEMLHAISEAVEAQVANRMTGTNLAALTDTQWEESEGWSTSGNSIVRGITLYSNNSSQNPSIAQYRLSYDSQREAMDLKSKAYDPNFIPSEAYVWTRAEHSDSDGAGTFSVSRNSGAQWEVVPMVQQGLSFGDIRIMRGTVSLGTQPSGQDLRCRYQTAQGKDQFLHSWGLQAKS
jgi:hypothetical protein